MRVSAPFDFDDGEVLAESEDPIQSVTLFPRRGSRLRHGIEGRGQTASRTGARSRLRRRAACWWTSTTPSDPTTLQGDLTTDQTGNGISYALVSRDGSAAYLTGPGYKEDFRPATLCRPAEPLRRLHRTDLRGRHRLLRPTPASPGPRRAADDRQPRVHDRLSRQLSVGGRRVGRISPTMWIPSPR